MQRLIVTSIQNKTKAINMAFVSILMLILCGCNGYKYIELDVVNPGELQNALQKESNKVTDLRITGSIGQSDTEYLIELATSSDILTQIDFSNCNIQLPHHAFAGCTYIKSVVMPQFSMLSVPHHMFSGCTNLTNVQIPLECISIEEDAFKNCTSLLQIVLPSSIDNIQQGAFDGCTNITDIYCEATIPPQCTNQTFSQIANTVHLFVPKGCLDLYKKALGWNRIKNIVELKDSDRIIDTNWKKH